MWPHVQKNVGLQTSPRGSHSARLRSGRLGSYVVPKARTQSPRLSLDTSSGMRDIAGRDADVTISVARGSKTFSSSCQAF